MESLADFLGVRNPLAPKEEPDPVENTENPLDISDPEEFCKRVMASREFRQYIMNGIALGNLPPAVVTRVMDHAMGKPSERVEHTGKDGAPIVTEIRRVIVHAPAFDNDDDGLSKVTH